MYQILFDIWEMLNAPIGHIVQSSISTAPIATKKYNSLPRIITIIKFALLLKQMKNVSGTTIVYYKTCMYHYFICIHIKTRISISISLLYTIPFG